MHKKNTFHDIVNITDCQIVDNDYNSIVKCALNVAQQMELPFYHKMRHEGYFRHLVVRRSESSGNLLINIVTTSQAEADLSKLSEALLELPLNGKLLEFFIQQMTALQMLYRQIRLIFYMGKIIFMRKSLD